VDRPRPGPRRDRDAASAARQLLVERYGGAVRNYLRAVLGDPDAADELAQEFALGLVRGEFRRADPRRGRFRNYIKAVLFHLVARHRRAARRTPRPMSDYGSDVIDVPAPADDESRFDRA
jgi:RNA polymerase sigma-70 factor (ECF subfamily)